MRKQLLIIFLVISITLSGIVYPLRQAQAVLGLALLLPTVGRLMVSSPMARAIAVSAAAHAAVFVYYFLYKGKYYKVSSDATKTYTVTLINNSSGTASKPADSANYVLSVQGNSSNRWVNLSGARNGAYQTSVSGYCNDYPEDTSICCFCGTTKVPSNPPCGVVYNDACFTPSASSASIGDHRKSKSFANTVSVSGGGSYPSGTYRYVGSGINDAQAPSASVSSGVTAPVDTLKNTQTSDTYASNSCTWCSPGAQGFWNAKFSDYGAGADASSIVDADLTSNPSGLTNAMQTDFNNSTEVATYSGDGPVMNISDSPTGDDMTPYLISNTDGTAPTTTTDSGWVDGSYSGGDGTGQTPYNTTGKSLGHDFGARLRSFMTDMQGTSLGQLGSGFFSGVPTGGTSSISFNAGVFGNHTYDFSSAAWVSVLSVIRAVILIIFGYAAVRIVILKR